MNEGKALNGTNDIVRQYTWPDCYYTHSSGSPLAGIVVVDSRWNSETPPSRTVRAMSHFVNDAVG